MCTLVKLINKLAILIYDCEHFWQQAIENYLFT